MVWDAHSLAQRLDTATKDFEPPFAIIDLGAFDANRRDVARRADRQAVGAQAGTEVALGVLDLAALDLQDRDDAVAVPGDERAPAADPLGTKP